MKQDRFLLLMLLAIGALIVLALALFFARRNAQDYAAIDDPAGVVRNYVIAMQKGDFERAYSYLASSDELPDLLSFTGDALARKREIDRLMVRLGETTQSGAQAIVGMILIYPADSPFAGAWQDVNSALLQQDSSGAWKIARMPYPFWQANWYPEKVSP